MNEKAILFKVDCWVGKDLQKEIINFINSNSNYFHSRDHVVVSHRGL